MLEFEQEPILKIRKTRKNRDEVSLREIHSDEKTIVIGHGNDQVKKTKGTNITTVNDLQIFHVYNCGSSVTKPKSYQCF